jgi:hypothetical protein
MKPLEDRSSFAMLPPRRNRQRQCATTPDTWMTHAPHKWSPTAAQQEPEVAQSTIPPQLEDPSVAVAWQCRIPKARDTPAFITMPYPAWPLPVYHYDYLDSLVKMVLLYGLA